MKTIIISLFLAPLFSSVALADWVQRAPKPEYSSLDDMREQEGKRLLRQQQLELDRCHHVIVDSRAKAFRCEDFGDNIGAGVQTYFNPNSVHLVHEEWRCSATNLHSLVPCENNKETEPPPCPLTDTSLNQCERERNREINIEKNER